MLQFRFQYCSEVFNTTVMISILQWLCQYHCGDFNTAKYGINTEFGDVNTAFGGFNTTLGEFNTTLVTSILHWCSQYCLNTKECIG